MAIKYKHLLVFCSFVTCVLSLRLGAFNVQVFGPTKASKQDVMGILARIAVRCDILLIQEIRDSKGQAILKLQERIKTDHGVDMVMQISDRLGRTRSKEQYAFLYRNDLGVSVINSLHFDDGDEATGEDLFQREPFIVRFQALNCEVEDFTLVALHTSPSKAVEEMTALSQVVNHINETWHTSDIMILGDLNADCRYVSKKAWSGIPLRQNSDFWWLITDDVDTTVGSTDCSYDRFILTGDSLKAALVPGSAKPFLFHLEYSLNDTQAKSVSDHYPIEVELHDKVATAEVMEWVTSTLPPISITLSTSTLLSTSAQASPSDPTPTAASRPTSDSTPPSDQTPSSDSTPTSDQTPSSDSTPTSDQTPSSDSTPTSDQTPSSDSTPTSDQTPSSDSTPTSDQTPSSYPTPTPDLTVTSGPTLISDPTLTSNSTPTSVPKPTSDLTPSSDTTLTVDSASTSDPTSTTSPAPTSDPTPTSEPTPTSYPTPAADLSSTLLPTSTPQANCASGHSKWLKMLQSLWQALAEVLSSWLNDIDLY